MIALQIEDVKLFMNKLLKDTVFDEFEVVSMDLQLGINIHIDGRYNLAYLGADEQETILEQSYTRWSELKPTILTLIKGNKPPLSMKIVLMISKSSAISLIERSQLPFKPEDVNGFYINLNYENNLLKLITGTSFKLFTLDKSLEKYYDETIHKFLIKHEMPHTFC